MILQRNSMFKYDWPPRKLSYHYSSDTPFPFVPLSFSLCLYFHVSLWHYLPISISSLSMMQSLCYYFLLSHWALLFVSIFSVPLQQNSSASVFTLFVFGTFSLLLLPLCPSDLCSQPLFPLVPLALSLCLNFSQFTYHQYTQIKKHLSSTLL